jgi:hypothetical protein
MELIWQGKPKYSEKPAPKPLCPPQIAHDLTWAGTRAAAVGNRPSYCSDNNPVGANMEAGAAFLPTYGPR